MAGDDREQEQTMMSMTITAPSVAFDMSALRVRREAHARLSPHARALPGLAADAQGATAAGDAAARPVTPVMTRLAFSVIAK
jgi:hypothetical protein